MEYVAGKNSQQILAKLWKSGPLSGEKTGRPAFDRKTDFRGSSNDQSDWKNTHCPTQAANATSSTMSLCTTATH